MSHNEEMVAGTDELTDAVQVVAETFPHVKADHRPQGSDWYRWLIWNDQTSERLATALGSGGMAGSAATADGEISLHA
jgi:hypothetical protein